MKLSQIDKAEGAVRHNYFRFSAHILEFLIEEKANLNAENNHGETALIRSIIEGKRWHWH